MHSALKILLGSITILLGFCSNLQSSQPILKQAPKIYRKVPPPPDHIPTVPSEDTPDLEGVVKTVQHPESINLEPAHNTFESSVNNVRTKFKHRRAGSSDAILQSKESYNFSKEPPFVRITLTNNREIYILGSQHTIPIDKFLHPFLIKVIKDIAYKKAILYTEHEITNMPFKEYINSNKNDCYSKKINSDLSGLKSFLSLNFEDKSPQPLNKLSRIKSWLLAPILSIHANIFFYKNFGGTEHTLTHGPEWQNLWKEKNFLETYEEIISILKSHEADDNEKNIMWINNSIKLIKQIENSDAASLNINIENNAKIMSGRHHWSIINNPTNMLPKSAISRNKLWVQKISGRIFSDTEENHILIVIGNGHLQTSESFIRLLVEKIRPQIAKTERFSIVKGWLEINLN